MGRDASAASAMARRTIRMSMAVLCLCIGAAACTTNPPSRPFREAGATSPANVGIAAFDGDAATAALLVQVLRDDLRRGGNVVQTFEDSGSRLSTFERPDWATWRSRGASAALGGRVETLPDGRLHVEVRLWDVVARKELGGLQFTTPPNDRRLIAHGVANLVQEKLTGTKGNYLDRRLKISATETRYALLVTDSDGADERSALNAPKPLLMPTWTSDRKSFAYVSLETPMPTVWLQDLETGIRQPAAAATPLAQVCPSEAEYLVSPPALTPPARLLEEGWEKNTRASCRTMLLTLASRAEAKVARVRLGLPASPRIRPDSELSYAERIAKAVRTNVVMDTSSLVNNPMVDIEVRIAPDGHVLGATIKKPSDVPEWDEAALRSVFRTGRLPLDVNGHVPSILNLQMKPLQ